MLAAGQALGGTFSNDFRVPGVDSQRAADLARDHYPAFGSASADIVWHVESGTLRDPAVAAAVADMVAEVRGQPDVTEATDPLLAPGTPGAGGAVSADGRTALATVRYGPAAGELTGAAYDRLAAAAAPLRARGVAVDFRGLVVDLAFEPATGRSELIGLGIAALVLLLAFGSVVAAGLPIVIALVGLVVGTAGVLVAAAFVDIPTSAPIIAVMLGIGAGVDYALFVVTRFRRALADGEAPVAAAGAALATAGHAVLYAGATVVVAILGLTFAGIPFLGAMGVAAALVVAIMVVAALTLLPALLGLLGHRVNLLRPLPRRAAPPVPAGAGGGGQAGRWGRWGTHLGRHRLAYAVGAAALLLALAAPLLSLRLGTPDDGNQPLAWPQRRAYDTVAQAFGPGWNAPLL
ncbi:MAG TPA: MMPL family transporter, partial [Pilimelia sp.]|nr:MMPL family transporter [Pilimelia sp.]